MSSSPLAGLAGIYGRRANPEGPKWATPGDLARALDPKTVQTPALDLIDRELVRVFNEPDGRLIVSMPPQEGKSSRVSRRFPEWILTQRPGTRIAIASYASSLAMKMGRQIRDDFLTHSEILGHTVRPDLANQQEWELIGTGGGVYSAGVGSSLTGRAVDCLLIDDPLKDRAEAESEKIRERCFEWWTDVGSTRLAPGAPVVLILTRWHEDDLAGRLLKGEDGQRWRVVNIPAQAESDDDPLGRAPGEFMESARRRTVKQWEDIRTEKGPRTWASLYQGRPAPAGGTIFQVDRFREYDTPLWTVGPDGSRTVPGPGTLIQSWDMTFKATTTSDYVVGQVWLHRGADTYLLDQIRERMGFSATVEAVKVMSARWPQASAKLVEDKANGTAVLETLARTVPGLIPVTPHESKEARAHAVTPYVEAGNVHLPSARLAPWAAELREELKAFPAGAHDDQVDALTQGLQRCYLTGGQVSGYLEMMRARLAARKEAG